MMMLKMNDEVSITFDFTGEKGTAGCFIIKYINITFQLPSNLTVIEYSRENIGLCEVITQVFQIEDHHLSLGETSFLLSDWVEESFNHMEEMEQAINEKVKKITFYLGMIKYPYQINLIIEGVY